MNMKSIVIGLCALSLNLGSALAADKPKLVRVPLEEAFIPQGFDSNDKAQLVVEGYLPNSCYRIGPTKTFLDEKNGKFMIEQWAYFHDSMCAEMVIPYQQQIEVGIAAQGAYKVQDVISKQILGDMPIRVATQVEPDEFIYASVRDAYLLPEERGPRIARIEGFFSNTCSRVKELRVNVESDKVVAILPIVERVPGAACNRVLVPMKAEARLPQLKAGRHLLHVRSLSGQSINKIFDVSPAAASARR